MKPLELDTRTVLRVLLILTGAFWAFSPALHGDWLWDDDVDITRNEITRSATGLWNIWFQPGAQLDYYPIKASIQWAQWHLWGDHTPGYHLTNIILHSASALLIWRLFNKLGLRLAWLGGLFFAVHPTAVESVAWIAELKNTLSLPPFLLAMCFYLDYEDTRRTRDYLLALGLFLVAMLCKTTMVMFPFVILLYAWWKRGRIRWHDLKSSAPFFIISATLGLVTLRVGTWYLRLHPEFVDATPPGGFFSRMALAGLSISFYFSKAALPVGLVPVYPQWNVDPPSLQQFLPWPILTATLYGCWARRLSWGRHALFGLSFFLIMLLPFISPNVVGYTKFTWVMDHFLYIPIIGLIGLVVAGLDDVGKQLSPSVRPFGIGLVAVVAAFLTLGSYRYAGKFTDQNTLWTYTLEHNPKAWPALNNLGSMLLVSGDVGDALALYEQALQLNPASPDIHSNYGKALMNANRLPEALMQFNIAFQIRPNSAAHAGLGDVLTKMGRPQEALEHYQQALVLNPANADANFSLGTALAQSGHIPEAIAHFELALKSRPDFVEAHCNLGNVFLETNRLDEAIDQYELALSINPDSTDAHTNLGSALYKAGRIPEAIDQYQAALAINPNLPAPRLMLKRLLPAPVTAPTAK